MTEQLFRLCDESDVEGLRRLFPTGAVAIKKIEDAYYLQLPDRESPLDENDALEVAKVALSRLSGIALLEVGNFRPPTILGTSKRDPSTGKLTTALRITVKAEVRSYGYVSPKYKLPDGTFATNESPRTFGEIVTEVANENKYLSHALSVFGQESGTWRGLYKVLDAIREPYRKKLKNLYDQFPTFKDDIENFKHHADCYAALGADARHGFINWQPPKKKMSLVEARNLIRGLLNAWVKKLTPGD